MLEVDVTPKTLARSTEAQLKRDIVAGRYAPGARLRVQDLAKNYDVGASPVREALCLLVGNGLVESHDQKGFSVPTLSKRDLDDITAWRLKLECGALDRSMANRTADWEATVLASHHRLRSLELGEEAPADKVADKWEELHRRFHRSLYAQCGSTWLFRFCDQLGWHSERYRRAFVEYTAISEAIRDEHQLIVDYVLADRRQEALDVLSRHIQRAAELASDYLERT